MSRAAPRAARRPALGLLMPLPADAPPSLVTGVWLWRALVVLLPLATVAAALLGVEAGRQMQAQAEAIPWFVHLVTLGILWIALTALGALIAAAALLLGVLALPLAFLLDRQLHRLLARDEKRPTQVGATMAAATVAGLVTHAATSWATGATTLLLPLAAVVAAVLVTRPDAKRALRDADAHGEAELMDVPLHVPVAVRPHVAAGAAAAPAPAPLSCAGCGRVARVQLAPMGGTLCARCQEAPDLA